MVPHFHFPNSNPEDYDTTCERSWFPENLAANRILGQRAEGCPTKVTKVSNENPPSTLPTKSHSIQAAKQNILIQTQRWRNKTRPKACSQYSNSWRIAQHHVLRMEEHETDERGRARMTPAFSRCACLFAKMEWITVAWSFCALSMAVWQKTPRWSSKHACMNLFRCQQPPNAQDTTVSGPENLFWYGFSFFLASFNRKSRPKSAKGCHWATKAPVITWVWFFGNMEQHKRPYTYYTQIGTMLQTASALHSKQRNMQRTCSECAAKQNIRLVSHTHCQRVANSPTHGRIASAFQNMMQNKSCSLTTNFILNIHQKQWLVQTGGM